MSVSEYNHFIIYFIYFAQTLSPTQTTTQPIAVKKVFVIFDKSIIFCMTNNFSVDRINLPLHAF